MATNQFIKLYNDPKYTVFDIKKELGLNNHQYKKLRQETGVKNRKTNYSNCKHYTKLPNGKYSIRKSINGKSNFLGVYNTKEDTKKVITICEEYDWDLSNPKIIEAISKYRVKNKNYCKINNRYFVYHAVNGKRIYYDSFKEEKDAIQCTKLLDTLDWNKTAYEQLKIKIKRSKL